jgi:HSP20 family protein
MARERDLFANFERMRREIDELFGEVWQHAPLAQRRVTGFSPRVDVYYVGEPPTAVVKADVSGVALEEINIEVSGRTLVISGHRPVQETEGRVYQQVEIPSGAFRRVIELGAEVDPERATATYEDGVLRIELPLVSGDERSRRVPIERGGE